MDVEDVEVESCSHSDIEAAEAVGHDYEDEKATQPAEARSSRYKNPYINKLNLGSVNKDSNTARIHDDVTV